MNSSNCTEYNSTLNSTNCTDDDNYDYELVGHIFVGLFLALMFCLVVCVVVAYCDSAKPCQRRKYYADSRRFDSDDFPIHSDDEYSSENESYVEPRRSTSEYVEDFEEVNNSYTINETDIEMYIKELKQQEEVLAKQIYQGSNDNCTICLGENESENMRSLACKHTFHTDCINTWFQKQYPPRCPICKCISPEDFLSRKEEIPMCIEVN
jgi:hypothetical protein